MNGLNKPINEFRLQLFADGGNLTDNEMSKLLNDKIYSVEVENIILSRIKQYKNDIDKWFNGDEITKNKITDNDMIKILDMIFEHVDMIQNINDIRKNNNTNEEYNF